MGEDHLLPRVNCERLEFNTRSIQPRSQSSEEFPNTLNEGSQQTLHCAPRADKLHPWKGKLLN